MMKSKQLKSVLVFIGVMLLIIAPIMLILSDWKIMDIILSVLSVTFGFYALKKGKKNPCGSCNCQQKKSTVSLTVLSMAAYVGVLLGVIVAAYNLNKSGFDPSTILLICIVSLFIGIIFVKLLFVVIGKYRHD